MKKIDWVSLVFIDNFASFLKDRLKIDFSRLDKRQGRDYGTYFAVYTDMVKDGIAYFGNYGLLNAKMVENNMNFEDDFEYLEKNPFFMQEYVAFMHQESKVDNKPKRLDNKTYVMDFNERYKNYLEQKNEKGEE